ncbi:MAG: HlyD family type I secretion periplasmic adaptor subunit [Ideonella sp.]|nr:HlyD family type I secretion periplasmic adaptor subunit [Ideonella sp.]
MLSARDAARTAPRDQGHPALDLLARYGAVLRAAWAARRELAGPRRLADEAAFLPAALSLQETPVHPAPRRAMAVIVALFVAALAWSVLGQVDIVAVAAGRIVISQRSKVVQPLETSVVRAIHVKDGDRVQQGQVLVDLDATASDADHASVAEQQLAARGELARSVALLRTLQGAAAPKLERTGEALPADAALLLQSEWSDIAAKRARLEAEAQRRAAELVTHQQQLAKLDATAPLVRQREADVKSLADQGFIAGHAGQDRTRERIEIERDIATQAARIAEAQAAFAESRQAGSAYVAETRRALNDRAAQGRVKLAQLTQELLKTERRQTLTHLTAPVAGTVQQLAIHTAGGVVTEAQPLMVIVPDGGAVTAEVVVENKDIGFVRAGQEAAVKLETFNFTRYGTVPAKVTWVTADAVNDDKRGAIFPATLELLARDIEVDGKRIALAPGMSLAAEIKTGRRRVIGYLLSPVQQRVSSSLHER